MAAAVSIATENVPAQYNNKMAAAAGGSRLQAGSVLVYIAPLESELLNHLEIYTAGTIGPTLQAVKAKCRELVRSDPLLLAGPIGSKSLYVICKKKYFTPAMKKDLLSKFNIQLLGEEGGKVTLPLLKHCYEFTLKGRLTPKWNEIDEWLVKGNDIFITGKTLALKVDIEVSVNELIVSVTSHKLSVRHLQPVDLEVNNSMLRLFTEGISRIINEESISVNQCYVLPNLTEAHVYSVSHVTPPTNSQFNNYDAIRQHWKKQYGFILPSTQSLFYQIFFSFNPTTFLSYPGCCVIKGRPLVIPSNCVHESGETFINDIHTRVPTICGMATRYITNYPLGLVNQLMNPAVMRYPANTRPAVAMANYGSSSTGGNSLPSTGGINLPSTGGISLPSTRGSLPSTGGSLPSTGGSLPSTRGSLPSTGGSLPSTRGSLPSTRGSLPSTGGNSLPSTRASLPSTGGSLPSTGGNSLPSTRASLPSTGGNSLPSNSCYGSSKRVHGATSPAVLANGPSVSASSSNGSFKRRRLTDEEEGLSSKRYQTEPDVKCIPEQEQGQAHRVSSVEEIKLQKSRVPALKSWLQSHNVHYQSRDKKETLINLIKSHITSTGVHYN